MRTGTFRFCVDKVLVIIMITETVRLRLREYTFDDFDPLYEILSDEETMRHYPEPFDEEKVRGWIRRNIDNYAEYEKSSPIQKKGSIITRLPYTFRTQIFFVSR